MQAVKDLNGKCADYYLMHEGEQPTEKHALEIFKALPPGKNYEDKFVLGIFRDKNDLHGINELLGIIDLVKNFPVEGEWMLGLFYIDPKERGKGLGKLVHQTLTQWAGKFGAKSFRIGVLEENYQGKHFWSGLGYRKVKESFQGSQQNRHLIHVMNLQLS